MQCLQRNRCIRPLLLLCSLAALVLAPAAPAHSQPADDWQATPVTTAGTQPCLDPTRPATLVVAEGAATVAYDWQNGTRRLLAERAYDRCGPAGLLFDVPDVQGAQFDGPTWRYDLRDGATTIIDHAPTHYATDGTRYVYTLNANGRLWASADGGLHWQRRDQRLPGTVAQLAVSAADARALYATVLHDITSGADPNRATARARIYFSADAGQNWELRSEQAISGPRVGIERILVPAPLPGSSAPVSALLLFRWDGVINPSSSSTVFLSRDGGRTFAEVGVASGFGNAVALVHTRSGILRLIAGRYGGGAELTRLAADGQTWQPLDLPPIGDPRGFCDGRGLEIAAFVPEYLLLCVRGSHWFTPDGGFTWQPLAGARHPQFTSYVPLTLFDLRDDGRLYTRELPAAGPTLLLPVQPIAMPDSAYFPETGHNLSGAFAAFWRAHGGIDRFGYPRTEPFREFNTADGRIYLVQYFERARLEYLPPQTCDCATIRIGLLGGELTTEQRAAGAAPFQPVADPQQPESRYFPETGHTLGGAFRWHWEQHGGLDQFGYPLSEEFRTPVGTTGEVYLVQYFQRARFEWHPGPDGGSVKLGLLGNELLAARGWR